MSATFRSLLLRNYRLWFAGATISNIGTWMQRTAQDWIVLTELTDHDATAVGITMALQFGPVLILAPLSGVVADSFDRRCVLIVTQTAMALVCLFLGLATLTGVLTLWMVFVLAGMLGVASSFDGPVRQSLVSELVPDEYLSNAIGLNSTSFTVARFIGPSIAGILVATTSAGWVFVINFVTFAATIAALLAMRRDELRTEPRPDDRRLGMHQGWAILRQRHDLVTILVAAFVFTAMGMNFPIFISTMATLEFDAGAGGFGILTSVVAVGSIAGALLNASREKPRLRLVAAGALAFGIMTAIAAFAPNVWLFGILVVGLGVSSLVVVNSSNAYVQISTPAHARGRIMAIYMALVRGSTVFGAPLVGWVADATGPRWAMTVGALGGFVSALIIAVWWLRANEARVRWDRGNRWRVTLTTRPYHAACAEPDAR